MDRMGRKGNVVKNGWSRMDCKGQWEYGVKQCASYGGNALRVRERGREEQKEGETYKRGDKSGIAWEKEEVYRETQRVSGRVRIINPKGGQNHMVINSLFPHLD